MTIRFFPSPPAMGLFIFLTKDHSSLLAGAQFFNLIDGLLVVSKAPVRALGALDAVLQSPVTVQAVDPKNPLLQWQLVNTSVGGVLFQLKANASLCLDGGSPLPTCQDPRLASLPFCDQTLDTDTRARDLVSRMTLNEKVLNLQNNNPGVGRLGVPSFSFGEALHGVVAGCGSTFNNNTGCPTSFPHALLLGGTFNSTLWRAVGTVAPRNEGAGKGMRKREKEKRGNRSLKT